MIPDQTMMVRQMVIEITEGHGIIEIVTLIVAPIEETTPLAIKGIQITIGMQTKVVETDPVWFVSMVIVALEDIKKRINGKMYNFLIDSGVSKSVISRNFYDSLPEPKPSIQNTNIKLHEANGCVNKAADMCHLPVTLTFGTLIKSIYLPVFICHFLSPNVNCVFGIDTGRAFKYVLCCDTGTIWCLDDPNQSPLYGIPNVITQDDNVYATVLKWVVIKAQNFAPIEVGTHNAMPPQEWRSQVLCTCTDHQWTEFGATVLQGMVDFYKGSSYSLYY